MKKILSLLFAVIAGVGIMFAESGTCGDNLTWNLTDGVLTISGTGSMEDYSYSLGSPWHSLHESIKEISIGSGVTSIGKYAFWNCTGPTSISIPNSVTSIGEFAFWACTGLTSVTIPNSVTSIGMYAFEYCSSLTSPIYNTHVFGYMPTSYSGAYAIPDGIESIAATAFNRCSDLTSITIPNSVTSIGGYAFSYCYGLTSVTLPLGVTQIEAGTFLFCGDLTTVTIPDGVTSIGADAFDSCASLISINIPNSVTSIGNHAFADCTGLTSVTIPNSVTSIGDGAFGYCNELTNITMGSGVTSIGEYVFDRCSKLTSIYVPCGELTRFQQLLNNDKRVKYPPTNISLHLVAENGNVQSSSYTTICDTTVLLTPTPNYGYHFVQWNDGNTDSPRTIEFTQDTTFTAEFAKNTYTIQTEPNNPEWGITFGDTSALYLDEVQISAVPNYGYHFVRWNDLLTVTEALKIASTLNKGEKSKEKYTIGGYVVRTYGTYSNSYYIADSSAQTSGLVVFKANNSASIGDKVIVTGYLYNYNGTLETAQGGNLKKLSENIDITQVLTERSRNITVTQDTIFKTIFAPNTYSITTIADEMLGAISGPSQAEYLDTITLTAIPVYGYDFVQWSDGIMDNPRTFILTKDTTFTAEFEQVIYENVQIGDLYYNLNLMYKTAEVTYKNRDQHYMYNEDWDITIANIPETVVYNGRTCLVTNVGDNAFNNCRMLISVKIPNSVTSIGDHAFEDCSGLTSIEIPNSVTSIGDRAFEGCSGLTSIEIPNSVTSIGNAAFEGCSGLTSIEIPNSVTSIGNYAFFLCTGLTTVTIPNKVTSINAVTFGWCSNLTSVIIPDSITEIGIQAFKSCSSLKTVTLGHNISTIANDAFSKCTSLITITCLGEFPALLGSNVFNETNDCPIYIPCNTEDAYQTAWSEYAQRLLEYKPLPYKVNGKTNNVEYGNVKVPTILTCETATITITAIANYGHHFVQWNDGNTDNPRTINFTQDTTFIAEFAKNTYTIRIEPNNPEWGTTTSDTSALYLDEVEISATPNYGYHFVSWNDGDTSNPRTISVTEDKTYQAILAKNIYNIIKTVDVVQGTINGPSQAEYLDNITLIVVPNYGYHFTQWSDGTIDNPRSIIVTQDTIIAAEFAYDRTGTCGRNMALIWSYDPATKVLTISNEGSFDENMECGVEARKEMKELIIDNQVTTIGADAFSGIETLTKVSIGESVKTIGQQAFYNCVNLETIYNYRPTPANAYSTAFDGVDKFECKLFVLATSINMYKAAAVWRDFYYTYAIGATETTTIVDDVIIEPTDNTAVVTWPVSNNAASYTITITKDGEVVCTLIFNSDGQLIGIAFAPSRDGKSQIPTATLTANGMQFTVTGLNSGTHYALNLTAKDSQDAVIASYSGEFTTTNNGGEVTSLDKTTNGQSQISNVKFIKNGQLFIQQGDKTYNAQGARVK